MPPALCYNRNSITTSEVHWDALETTLKSIIRGEKPCACAAAIMKRLVVGITAHVDSGKTTLSEALLYRTGEIRKLGRVDHQTAFLDTHPMERDRGITIFAHQACIACENAEYTLLDTPGHVDFSAETERTMQVLDYAILVISGTDGVQSHTETLWKLLERYQVPVFLFVNKMDLAGADKAAVLEQLQSRLSDRCVDFSADGTDAFYEQVALLEEPFMDTYLEQGKIPPELLAKGIARRKLIPCYFGAALKLEGVDAFLEGLHRYTLEQPCPAQFGARVFKIAADEKGNRLSYLKITGGRLRVYRAPVPPWCSRSRRSTSVVEPVYRLPSPQRSI